MRHYCDMMRVMAGIAAWTAGTAVAVSIAWFGANVVVRNAGVEPGMPVINAAVLPASASPTPVVTPPVVVPSSGSAPPSGSATPARTPTGHSAAANWTAAPGHWTPAPAGEISTPAGGTSVPAGETSAPAGTADSSPSAAPSAAPVHAYALTGGTVTLDLANGAVQLVTAVPDNGYSVQTWSGTDWLRVDFSSGTAVSSLIASWYEHAPTITVTN
jgi:Divergent InlB B-repeat domain